MEGFRRALEDSMLTEIELAGGRFTWEKGRGTSSWVQERLDRAFATKEWWLKFPLCKLNLYMAHVSDHEPIHLELWEVAVPRRVFRFKFENTWLKEPSFIQDVTNHWVSIDPSSLLPKLISVSRYMKNGGGISLISLRRKSDNKRTFLRV